MRFEIVHRDESYGRHRFSNNAILHQLSQYTVEDGSLLFVWWAEKMFLQRQFVDVAERLCKTPWFGALHIPLLTPKWATHGQNNISKLYFDGRWRQALKNCRGLITLSKHLREQVEAAYPGIPVFDVKHPIGCTEARFQFSAFARNPRLVLVGTWLRDFEGFCEFESGLKKELVLNHYTDRYLKGSYSQYSPSIVSDIGEISRIDFLDDDAYDQLMCSSVIYLRVHETSANNAVCESIQYATPFLANRHPAIVEYVGEDYPLFLDSIGGTKLTTEQVRLAHEFLLRNEHLREQLTYDKFVEDFREIYESIARQ